MYLVLHDSEKFQIRCTEERKGESYLMYGEALSDESNEVDERIFESPNLAFLDVLSYSWDYYGSKESRQKNY